jgi:hypothetical protein
MLSDDHPQLAKTTPFTFTVNSTLDDRGVSPWTRVTHKFRGLALEGGGGDSGSSTDSSSIDQVDESPRKRVKIQDVEMVDAGGVFAQAATAGSLVSSDAPVLTQESNEPSAKKPSPLRSVSFAIDEAVVEQTETMANTRTDNESGYETGENVNDASDDTSSTSAQQSTTSKSQPRKRNFRRAGTPPFARPDNPSGSGDGKSSSKSTASRPTIVDPVRAALTWREDEITIYDPDDSDDDGTGINGIGFKPTPAIAYARSLRRRQQMAEYKRREEREARAKRSMLRRRGDSPSPGVMDAVAKATAKSDRRRVRFLERAVERELEGGVAVKVTMVGGEVVGV